MDQVDVEDKIQFLLLLEQTHCSVELRNPEGTAHVKEKVGGGSWAALGSARLCWLWFALCWAPSRLPKNFSSSSIAKNGEQHGNRLGSHK